MKKQGKVLLLPPPRPVVRPSRWLMVIAPVCAAVLAVVGAFSYLLTQTHTIAIESASALRSTNNAYLTPFPLGVDPKQKSITENPNADSYLTDVASRSLARGTTAHIKNSALAFLSAYSWFQNIASPTGRIIIIQPGERKEEIAAHIAHILGWSTAEEAQFLATVASTSFEMSEGVFFPATYVAARSSSPDDVALLVSERFATEVKGRYSEDIARVVPLKEALTVASLLEREAYGFEDMRLISGVIWNRLFAGMKLQIDATMQYAKGGENAWWPAPTPSDKSIASPFNTYAHEGLPPSPIANPSLDAIVAALNPKKTECMFYFHDSHANFHCARTYEEHVALLKQYYGSGK